MELLTKTGLYTPYENDATASYLEVYRLPQDTLDLIEKECLPTDAIMEMFGFSNARGFVEPGAWYTEYHFVALNQITGILVIEVQKSLNV